MGKKTKVSSRGGLDSELLQKRAETALRGGQSQQALDLARTLFAMAPEPANRVLLVSATLTEAERLIAAGQPSQAGPVASKVFKLVESAEEKSRLADILAKAGNLNWAWDLANQVNDAGLTLRVLGHVADAAMRDRPIPATVPESIATQKGLVVRAFAEAFEGHDDKAQATVQDIGLSSAFLEWKVMLRGFLCFYRNDDAKALENWARLGGDRIPSLLVAPFRMTIDASFRESQKPKALESLQEALEETVGAGLAGRLRGLRRPLVDKRHLGPAFRLAERLVPTLNAEFPHLVPRLAGCFFWAIIVHGFPHDLQHYQRVFGFPVEDPQMLRLEALAMEARGDLPGAHAAWGQYQKSVAERAAALPQGHADRIRSLVWQRMADNANAHKTRDQHGPLAGTPLGRFFKASKPLSPSAEKCYQESLKLAPGELAAHDNLVRHYWEANQPAKALNAAKKLLANFPNHGPTLELAGNLSLQAGKCSEAVNYFARASESNPLEARLRSKVGRAHVASGVKSAKRKSWHKAREAFAFALEFLDSSDRLVLLCRWSAVEFLAGDAPRAEELLQQSRQQPSNRQAAALAMLAESCFWKLAKPLKDRFEAEFNESLAAELDGASVAALATQSTALRDAGAKYVGQKVHEKKVAGLLLASNATFTEGQLQIICEALADLGAFKALGRYYRQGQRLFPSNPRFYLAEVDFHLLKSKSTVPVQHLFKLLDKVRTMASMLPSGDRAALLQLVQERDQMVRDHLLFDPFSGFMDLMEDAFGDDEDDDVDLDDDDLEEWADD